MSVCCTEMLKTAEIQPCYSFSPEALSSPSSTAHSWSPEAVKVSNILLALRIGNCFSTSEMPRCLFPYSRGTISLAESTFCCCSVPLSQGCLLLGFLTTLVILVRYLQKNKLVFLWFCPHPRGGDLLLLLEISAILGHLVNPPS